MHTQVCTLNNCVVSYKSLQCCLDFQHCSTVYNICWRWIVEVQQTACFWWNRRPWSHCSFTLVLLALGQFDVSEVLLETKQCLQPEVFLFLLHEWVGWVVLMNYRVSTRETNRLKEGGELCSQWAGIAAEGIQSCWGGKDFLIACKGSFDFFRQHASI